MSKTIGYIICETASTESDKQKIIGMNNDRVTIETGLQDVNTKNRNGRFYEDKELIPQLKSPRILELIENNSFYGEAGHPTSSDIARQQTIDPTNMSHRINKLWVDGNNIMGLVSAANTSVGDDFQRLILDKTKVAFSLRALGVVKNTSRGAEVKNIRIITWDTVIFPSHKVAYMNNIVNTNDTNSSIKENNMIITESDNGLIIPITNNKVVDYIKEESKNIKNVIESFEFMYKSISLNEFGNMVTLVDNENNKLFVHLESHIQNEIMNHCYDKYNKRRK